EMHELVLRSEAVFTEQFFRAREAAGAPQRDPIFIVGLPRAGSALIEQILASPSPTEGTIELQYMALIRRGLTTNGPASYLDRLTALPAEELGKRGEIYLADSAAHRKTGKPH